MKNPFAKRKAGAASAPDLAPPRDERDMSAISVFWSRLRQSGLDPEKLFAKRRPPPSPRSVFFNEPLPPEYFDKNGKPLPKVAYPTNQVITAKYTIYNFIFKNLLEQFRRVANIFFLLLVILQFLPEFSTINPFVAMLPLLVVLGLTALKDGYEDIKRHQSDRTMNRQKVRVMTSSNWINPNLMEPKERSVGAIWTAFKDSTLGGKKRQSAKLASRQQNQPHLQRVVTNPQQTTAVAPGAGTVPDTQPGTHSDVGNEPRTSTSAGRPSLSGQSRASTSGASMYEVDGYVVDEEGRVFHHGRQLSAQEESKYKAKAAPRWKPKMWEDLAVGDFVLIKDNEPIPADIIICSTSEDEDACFIETKNLDGETNLKARTGVPEMATQLRCAADCATAAFRADGEPQDTNMYRLNANIALQDRVDQEGNPLRCPVTLNQILLRGCVLRNTKWVIGFVFMTGADTKIIANSGATPSKRSKVERQMNPMVYVNLSLLAAVAVGCAIANSLLELRYFDQNAPWEYGAIYDNDNPRINGLIAFGNALITFQNIVPISLYISIEIVRTAQNYFIYDDFDIWYEKTNRRTTARSWNLADDLGQIEYVFSDKTGTLTQNLMLFQECSIGGVAYHGDGDRARQGESFDGSLLEKEKSPSTPSSSEGSSAGPGKGGRKRVKQTPGVAGFRDSQLNSALKAPKGVHSTQIFQFWRCLALCHTALASADEDGFIEFKAQSPDEQALVQAAAEVGFIFLGRDRTTLSIQVPGVAEPEKYELLSVLEFTSARKRMSVVLRRHSDSKILVLAKGADSIIYERSAAGQEDIKAKIDEHLEEFANKGLRTLCLAGKELTEERYNEWAFRNHNASVSLEDREGKMEALASELEQDFTLYGATAIEDKLQDGVPEAIADLKRAGIKVWVATGDKLETAIAIGYSTKLLVQDMNLIVVRGGEYGEPNSAYLQLKKATERFFGGNEIVSQMEHQPPGAEQPSSSRFSLGSRRPSLQQNASRTSIGNASLVGDDNGSRTGGYALVIDGNALTHALTEDFSKDLLLNLSSQCRAVICCRVSPLQKALIVRLIKDGLGVMTLAIGDGANDVSMIQAAHVGVGIAGEEGLQAVNSSDYAIAQFRFLKRLLLVHGHFCYYRSGLMISYFFYKQMIIVSFLFFFQIYAAWSTIYIIDYVYILLYNLVWTVLACFGAGIFDRPLSDRILMEVPELYKISQKGTYFGAKPFARNMIEGAIQGVIVMLFFIYTYDVTTMRSDGLNVGLYEFSTGMLVASVFACNLFMTLFARALTPLLILSVFFGPIVLSCFIPIYNSLKPSDSSPLGWGNNFYLYRAFGWYCTIFFASALCLLPAYLYRCISETYYPTDMDLLRRMDKADPNHDYANDPYMPGKQTEAKLAAIEAARARQERQHQGDDNGGMDAPPTSVFAMHELHPSRSRASSRHYDMLTGSERPSRGYSFSQEDFSGGRERRLPADVKKKRQSTLRRLFPGSIRRSMRRNSRQKQPVSGVTEGTEEEAEASRMVGASGRRHDTPAEEADEEAAQEEEEEEDPEEAEVSRLAAGRSLDPGPEEEEGEDMDDVERETESAPLAAPALRDRLA